MVYGRHSELVFMGFINQLITEGHNPVYTIIYHFFHWVDRFDREFPSMVKLGASNDGNRMSSTKRVDDLGIGT